MNDRLVAIRKRLQDMADDKLLLALETPFGPEFFRNSAFFDKAQAELVAFDRRHKAEILAATKE